MKHLLRGVFGLIFLLIASFVSAQEIEDDFMKGIFQYLAKNRDMNLISYSGENIAEIGRLYFL